MADPFLWIVTTQPGPSSDGELAMIVPAATEGEAAALAADWFTEHSDYEDALPIRHVFVALWTGRMAYTIRCAAERAEHQCCGGGDIAQFVGLGGHWGGCPEATTKALGEEPPTKEEH